MSGRDGGGWLYVLTLDCFKFSYAKRWSKHVFSLTQKLTFIDFFQMPDS